MASYRFAADAVVILHTAFVAFVILMLPLAWLGQWRGWNWTRSWRLRLAHLAAIGYVVLMTWLGFDCPLTLLENVLREKAGQSAYPGDFIGYWAHELLFFELPPSAFVATYTLFGLAVALTWWIAPPRFRKPGGGSSLNASGA